MIVSICFARTLAQGMMATSVLATNTLIEGEIQTWSQLCYISFCLKCFRYETRIIEFLAQFYELLIIQAILQYGKHRKIIFTNHYLLPLNKSDGVKKNGGKRLSKVDC